MKFFSAILSICIMIQTFMPCADVNAADANSYSIIQQDQDHNHSNHIDLCSPFCFCICCQTLSQPAIYSNFQNNLVSFNLTIPSLVLNKMYWAISFWHPPKI